MMCNSEDVHLRKICYSKEGEKKRHGTSCKVFYILLCVFKISACFVFISNWRKFASQCPKWKKETYFSCTNIFLLLYSVSHHPPSCWSQETRDYPTFLSLISKSNQSWGHSFTSFSYLSPAQNRHCYYLGFSFHCVSPRYLSPAIPLPNSFLISL